MIIRCKTVVFNIAILFLAYRYLSIIKEEGLEISQPALDSEKSEVHHPLTARDHKLKVHRLLSFPLKCHYFLFFIFLVWRKLTVI